MTILSLAVDKTVRYFKESYFELKKVVWPTRQEIITHTIIVIVMSIFIAVFLGALDVIFTIGIEKLLLLKKS
ncbi:MAG: preprotein translocase subunit SecE [Patescibacteria group bacterium]